MAGSFTDYLENKVMNHVFGIAAYTAPAKMYLGLSTSTVIDVGTGITEPSGNAYARVEIANTTANWNTSTTGVITNKNIISFPEASGAWGTVTYSFVSDAPSGGNILFYGSLQTPKAVTAGDTVAVKVRDLSITLS